MRRAGAFALLGSSVIACSGLLGLTDPKEFPPEAGTTVADASASSTSSSGGSKDAAACNNADLTSDPKNCGACGHDCGAGKCEARACQPFLVATLPKQAAFSIASDEANLYAANGLELYRIEKSSGTVTPLAHPSPSKVARGGPKLYWATNDTLPGDFPQGTMRECDLPTCKFDQRLAEIGSAADIEPASGFGGGEAIAWIDADRAHVAVPGPTFTAQTIIADVAGSDRMFLHLVGDALYWSDTNKRIGRLVRGESTQKNWDTAPYQFGDFVILGDEVIFYSNRAQAGALARGKLGATTLEDVKDISPLAFSNAVELADGTIYVLSLDAILTCPASDCAALDVLVNAPSGDGGVDRLLAMNLDVTTVWYTTQSGQIYGIAK